LGETHDWVFLGMLHERDWERGVVCLSQPRHIDTVLPEHGFAAGRAASTPMDHKEMLLTTTVRSMKEHQLLSSYPAMVGSIRYIVNSSGSDLCYAAVVVARLT
jgi:hypothetical protein